MLLQRSHYTSKSLAICKARSLCDAMQLRSRVAQRYISRVLVRCIYLARFTTRMRPTTRFAFMHRIISRCRLRYAPRYVPRFVPRVVLRCTMRLVERHTWRYETRVRVATRLHCIYHKRRRQVPRKIYPYISMQEGPQCQ